MFLLGGEFFAKQALAHLLKRCLTIVLTGWPLR